MDEHARREPGFAGSVERRVADGAKAVRAVHLDDLDTGRGEVPGEARTVGSGALHAHTAHRAP